MKELEELTRTPRTTIHFYCRENILKPPFKTARNAALYSEEHRTQLDVIRRLRSGPYPVPLGVVRRALELVAKGVAPETAVALQQAVVGDQFAVAEEVSLDEASLAERAGVSRAFVSDLLENEILLPTPDTDPPFDALDLVIVQRISEFCRISGMKAHQLSDIARLFRKAIQLEMELRDQLVAGKSLNEAADVSRCGQLLVNVWHGYLTFRSRLLEIQERGLGSPEQTQEDYGVENR